MGSGFSGETPWRRVRQGVSPAVPAAGQDWVLTVPAGHLYTVRSCYGILTSSATVGQRMPRLQITDGVSIVLDLPPLNGQQSSVGHRYNWTEQAGPWQAVTGQPVSAIASAASTAALGTVLSYTVPAGGGTLLTGASFFLIGGTAPTVALQLVRGATTITLWSGSASTIQTPAIPLSAGDVIRWQVTAAGAGSTGDFSLSGEPSTMAGTADGEVMAIPALTLQPGWTIGTLTDNLQVGDQWSSLRLLVVDTTVYSGAIGIDSLPDLLVGIIGHPASG